MLPWKPLLAAVPAGLLLGVVAGQASRPVMLVKDDRPWPQSVREEGPGTDRWPASDLGRPETSSRGYSYRPDIDYDIFVWPDQTDRSGDMLAADYDYGGSATAHETDLPLTRRAVAELASRQAEALAPEATDTATAEPRPANQATAPDPAASDRGAFVLPPVPPPLARAGTLPEQTEEAESEAF